MTKYVELTIIPRGVNRNRKSFWAKRMGVKWRVDLSLALENGNCLSRG